MPIYGNIKYNLGGVDKSLRIYKMNVEKLEHSRKKVVFEVSAEEFDQALDKAFSVCNAKVKIKGFREGHAPRAVYEKTYGVESLYDEALNIVLNDKARSIYDDEELSKEIVGRFEPNFESDEKIEKGKPFKISLTFDVYPEFTLPQYKGVEVAKANLEVTDEEVDSAIKQLLSKDATMLVKENQVIESGDHATFDFVGTVDGVEFDGGKADNYELQIGSGQFIPGFEDQMIGMKAGEVKDVNVTFPENYGEKSLAGKPAVFKVTLHEVKNLVYPELNEETVKNLKIENVNTVEELKSSKKAELEVKKAESEKNRQLDEIINKIIDNTVVDMPKALEEEKVNAIRAQYENQAKMYNIPFDTFLGLMNVTKEAYEEETLKQGKRQAIFSVIVTKIIEEEKLAPSKEELEAKAEADALNTKSTKEEMLQKNMSRYFNDLAYTKFLDFLKDNSKEV